MPLPQIFSRGRDRGFGMSAQLPTRPEPRRTGSLRQTQKPKDIKDASEFDLLNMSQKDMMQFFVKNNLLTQMYASATMDTLDKKSIVIMK